MTYHDKIQLNAIIIAPPDQAAEGDRLFKSHGVWMESTHREDLELQRVEGTGALELTDLNSARPATCFA
jgi:hypothetical protein